MFYSTIFFLVFITVLKAEKLPTYKELSSLVSPTKLATLKKNNRLGNIRFKKLMYWTHQYEKNGIAPKVFLSELYSQFKGIKPYANELQV